MCCHAIASHVCDVEGAGERRCFLIVHPTRLAIGPCSLCRRCFACRVLGECQLDASEALRLQAAMGYGLEDTQMIIESMAQVRCACGVCCAGHGMLWYAVLRSHL